MLVALFTVLACAQPHEHGDAHHEAAHGDHEHGSHKHEGPAHHRFDDAEKWAKVFDDPARAEWQKPVELVAALGLSAGQTVADIGAGTGYFNPHLAKAVGASGKVLAIDVEDELIAHMRKRAEHEKTPQVEVRKAPFDGPNLKPAEADVVMLVDVYHHIQDRPAYFTKVREGVAPDGRLVVVDFYKDKDIPVGPPPPHRLAATTVKEELAQAGWTFDRSLDLLPYQYVLVFTR